jgi:hypothetical protein
MNDVVTEVVFAAVVDEEIGVILKVRSNGKLNTTLRLNPTVIEATNLGVMPPLGAIWNGESFDIPEDLMPLEPYQELNPEVFKVFAYVVDNIFVGRSVIRIDDPMGQMIFAVYGSNPTFVDITDQAEEIDGNPFDLIGRQIVNGQIVPE